MLKTEKSHATILIKLENLHFETVFLTKKILKNEKQ